MTRIYAIRTGQYSDTSWGPVFSTPEKALAYQRKLGTDRYSELCEIEVHVLDDEKDVGLVYPNWLIVFDQNGDVISHTQERTAALFEPLLAHPYVQIPPANSAWYFLQHCRVKAALVVRDIGAPDLEHAVKIASDKRAEWLTNHVL